jgi:hypothetical protein
VDGVVQGGIEFAYDLAQTDAALADEAIEILVAWLTGDELTDRADEAHRARRPAGGCSHRCCGERERLFPADEEALLPTRLGNVMRSGEMRAGAANGLDAVVLWPRLYPVLDETVRALTDDRRDQLDLSARFCAVFALAAVVLLGLLLMHGWWLAVPAGCLVLAWLAYRGTVTAALAYNEALRVAFDLHRFDLLTALHLPLPKSREEEKAQNDDLRAFLLQGWETDFKYEHPS